MERLHDSWNTPPSLSSPPHLPPPLLLLPTPHDSWAHYPDKHFTLLQQSSCQSSPVNQQIGVLAGAKTVPADTPIDISIRTHKFNKTNDQFLIAGDCTDPESFLHPSLVKSQQDLSSDSSTLNEFVGMFIPRGAVAGQKRTYQVCFKMTQTGTTLLAGDGKYPTTVTVTTTHAGHWLVLGNFSVTGSPANEIVVCQYSDDIANCVLSGLGYQADLRTQKGLLDFLPNKNDALLTLLDGQVECGSANYSREHFPHAMLLDGSSCVDFSKRGTVFLAGGTTWFPFVGFGADLGGDNSGCSFVVANGTEPNATDFPLTDGWSCMNEGVSRNSLAACSAACTQSPVCVGFDFDNTAGLKCRLFARIDMGAAQIRSNSAHTLYTKAGEKQPPVGGIFTVCNCLSSPCDSVDDFSVRRGYVHIEGPRFGPPKSGFKTYDPKNIGANADLTTNSALTGAYGPTQHERFDLVQSLGVPNVHYAFKEGEFGSTVNGTAQLGGMYDSYRLQLSNIQGTNLQNIPTSGLNPSSDANLAFTMVLRSSLTADGRVCPGTTDNGMYSTTALQQQGICPSAPTNVSKLWWMTDYNNSTNGSSAQESSAQWDALVASGITPETVYLNARNYSLTEFQDGNWSFTLTDFRALAAGQYALCAEGFSSTRYVVEHVEVHGLDAVEVSPDNALEKKRLGDSFQISLSGYPLHEKLLAEGYVWIESAHLNCSEPNWNATHYSELLAISDASLYYDPADANMTRIIGRQFLSEFYDVENSGLYKITLKDVAVHFPGEFVLCWQNPWPQEMVLQDSSYTEAATFTLSTFEIRGPGLIEFFYPSGSTQSDDTISNYDPNKKLTVTVTKDANPTQFDMRISTHLFDLYGSDEFLISRDCNDPKPGLQAWVFTADSVTSSLEEVFWTGIGVYRGDGSPVTNIVYQVGAIGSSLFKGTTV